MAATGQWKDPATGDWSLTSWRQFGTSSGADWPVKWSGPADAWPTVSLSARWIPEHPGRAVTVCGRVDYPGVEIIEWADLAEAVEAAALLFDRPCGPTCVGMHTLVWTDDKRGVNVRSIVARTPPPPLAEELAAMYPRRNGYTVGPECWPKPSILNQPLPPRGTVMTPETQRAQTEAVEQAAGRTITPEPGGASGRAARHHDAAVANLAEGDILGAVGEEIAAKAMTDVAVDEMTSATTTTTTTTG